MSTRLDNKVIVITGAASGMGRAATLRFLDEGAAVVAADLNVIRRTKYRFHRFVRRLQSFDRIHSAIEPWVFHK